MSTFLLIFFAIYGGMHLYTFLKARAAFRFNKTTGIALSIAMLCMVLSPILVRLIERHGYELAARLLAFSAYSWMGLLLLFVSVSLVIDIGRLALYALSLISKTDLSALLPSAVVRFFIPLLIATVAATYGFFEANNIRTERVVITSPKIPREAGRIKIAQISDVHLGLIVRERRLKKILDIVKREKPDILVSTGDLFDGQAFEVDGISSLFEAIQPPLGKYAITGNHEYYAGLENALAFAKQAGFVVLRESGATISGLINIAGVDDPAGKTRSEYRAVDEEELLSNLPQEKFTLLLKHRPVIGEKSEGLFDLQLSGHTHKGQIFPFWLAVKFSYPYIAGLYTLAKGSKLYTSRGSGTWGPPFRVLSPPEVTIIELIHGEKK